ncbi:contractile injection system protein, VgrG/Pvc8 family [Kosakonia sp. BYX6]|uniref:Contractile injection system protein, VgrG/Pvc8 family n=1 Tax=Kosakonia calanthes TaxID=3139408 RepID=A0ABZ3BB47_9ENTR
MRQQAWQAEQQQTQGSGTATGIAPGHVFTLTNAPNYADNAKWLVAGAQYAFEENQYASGGNAPQIADQILAMADDVDKLRSKLFLL